MPKKYRSGFERLGSFYPETSQRYAVAIQAIRENFTGFGIKDGFNPRKADKLTDAQKHQVRRYYNLLKEYIEGGPVYKMTPSELPKAIKKGGKKNIDAVMRAAQMPKGRKRAKYIFIKYDGETIPKIKVRNNAIVIVNDKFGTQKETIEIPAQALAIDARGVIMSLAPMTVGARYYRILNGRHEFYNAGDLTTLANQIERLQQKYVIGSKDSWDRWLHGVAAYYTDKRAVDIIQHTAETRTAYREKVLKEQRRLKAARK